MAKKDISSSIEIKIKDIVLVDPNKLKPDPKNPNIHSKESIDEMIKVISFNGWCEPITVSNRSGFIKTGHRRHLAALKMGLKKVPVSYQDFEDDVGEFVRMVSDNSIAKSSVLDMKMINLEIQEIGPFDVDLLAIPDFTPTPEEREKKSGGGLITCPECGLEFEK